MIPAAEIVSTDEFWDGSEFELSRLRREVFDPLVGGQPARFASFDWVAQEARGERTVAPAGIVVVEGVCALHRMFRDDYDLRVWVEAPRDVRLARGIARDGESARATWEEIWMPMEDRYVERDDPVAAADLIVDGTAPGRGRATEAVAATTPGEPPQRACSSAGSRPAERARARRGRRPASPRGRRTT